MAWLPILRIVNPASAYVQRVQRVLNPGPVKRRRPRPASKPVVVPVDPPDLPYQATSRERERVSAMRERLEDLRAELEPIRAALREHAKEMLQTGGTSFRTKSGLIDVKLLRFWNGSGVLQGRLLGRDGWARGPVFSLLDGRSRRQHPPTDLERELFYTVLNLEA